MTGLWTRVPLGARGGGFGRDDPEPMEDLEYPIPDMSGSPAFTADDPSLDLDDRRATSPVPTVRRLMQVRIELEDPDDLDVEAAGPADPATPILV